MDVCCTCGTAAASVRKLIALLKCMVCLPSAKLSFLSKGQGAVGLHLYVRRRVGVLYLVCLLR